MSVDGDRKLNQAAARMVDLKPPNESITSIAFCWGLGVEQLRPRLSRAKYRYRLPRRSTRDSGSMATADVIGAHLRSIFFQKMNSS
jgi:hypothetical protein